MMQIILDGKYSAERSVVALGMFDGVHIGHQVLLERGAALAKREGVPLVVCTFQDHPLRLIAPEKCPPQLTDFDERARLMEALGVDVFYAMPFSPEVMTMPPEDYVGHLVRQFHPTDVVCGYNHTFGRKGEGKPPLLQVLGGALGFSVSIVPKITLEGREISSTAIRAQLSGGNVAQARRLLGHPYEVRSQSVQREKKSCSMLLQWGDKQRLPHGEYRALVCTGERMWPVTVRLQGDEAVCSLPSHLQAESVSLAFLAQPL